MSPTTNLSKTDAEVKTDVVEELRWDSRLDPSDIAVRVNDGVVTLTGSVPGLGERRAAEVDAWGVVGVRWVENELVVRPPSMPPIPDDETLRDKALDTLQWNPEVDSANVSVEVDSGRLTLKGTVSTHWQKLRAEDLVHTLRGVLSVTNELAVVPTETFPDQAIAEDIQAALERNVLVEAGRVDVTVNGGTVRLQGSVPSDAARRVASRAASRTLGVVSVQNDLMVSF